MIKIIEKSQAGKYYCPVSSERNERCHGDVCMKWEHGVTKEHRSKDVVVTEGTFSRVQVVEYLEEVETGMGWCGL